MNHTSVHQHGAMEFTLPPVDLDKVRLYRLNRVRQKLKEQDLAGALLFDPLNIRYATDATNMQIFCSRYDARSVFVATDGPVVLWDFGDWPYLVDGLPTIDDYREIPPFYFFWGGGSSHDNARKFVREVYDVVKSCAGDNRRIAVDRCGLLASRVIQDIGLEMVEGQGLMEVARSLKSSEEIKLIEHSIHVGETGVSLMRRMMEPGVTENALWSQLHQTNISMGGEWIETRLLASGYRTNPWFHECSMKPMAKGEMVSFDTDLIGPYGYICDMSRAWICGEEKPKPDQARLYQLANEQIHFNIDLLRPGLSFHEFARMAWPLPDEFKKHRYGVTVHGTGLSDEYPAIKYIFDFGEHEFDGYFEPGMTLSVESFIGSIHGGEGVKLEEQVLITETGCRKLTSYPIEDW